jgi:hypothetical protein
VLSSPSTSREHRSDQRRAPVCSLPSPKYYLSRAATKVPPHARGQLLVKDPSPGTATHGEAMRRGTPRDARDRAPSGGTSSPGRNRTGGRVDCEAGREGASLLGKVSPCQTEIESQRTLSELPRDDPCEDPSADEQRGGLRQTPTHAVSVPGSAVFVLCFEAELDTRLVITLDHRDLGSADLVNDLDRRREVRAARDFRTELNPERRQNRAASLDSRRGRSYRKSASRDCCNHPRRTMPRPGMIARCCGSTR